MGATNPCVMDEPESACQAYGADAALTVTRLMGFETGSAELQPGHKSCLSGEIAGLMRNPGYVAFIIGHASRLGSAAFNLALSEARARATHDYLKGFIRDGSGRIEVYGAGETETLGKTENDPVDRAVVLIVQPARAKRPDIIPDPGNGDGGGGNPGTGPGTGQPRSWPAIPIPNLIANSQWTITGASGGSLGVPIPQSGGLISAGISVQSLEFTHKTDGRKASYAFSGFAVSAGVAPGKLIERIPRLGPFLKAIMDKVGFSYGPPAFPTVGTDIYVTPWLPLPVEPPAFSGSALIAGLGGSIGVQGAGSALIMSHLAFPMLVAPHEMMFRLPLWAGSIKGAGAFAGLAMAFPGFSFDLAVGTMALTRVTGKVAPGTGPNGDVQAYGRRR